MTPEAAKKSSTDPRAIFAVDNLVAVASGKGGVGKTWLSITLASALAYQGAKVLLFDGDLGLANVDVQLGITPERDLGAVIAGRAEMGDAITPYDGGAKNTGRKAGGFDVLAGRSGSGVLASLTQAELLGVAQGLKTLADQYDVVIADLAAGLDRSVTTLSALAGVTLVVLTDEPTSLTDAYAFIKVMTMRNRDADIRVVVNQAETAQDGRKVYQSLAKACQNFLDAKPPLAGVISKDPKVKDTIRAQSSIISRHPKSVAGADVSRLAASIGTLKASAAAR